MSTDYNIEQWRIKEFANNVYHLAQQKDAKMWSFSRHETQSSKRKFFDVIGKTDPIVKGTRHSDTPNLAIDHTRRAVDLVDYEWGKLVDDQDILRTLNDPTNEYAKAMSMGFKRKKDSVMIQAMLGSAYAGEEGGTTVALPNAQKIAAVAGSALTNLNLDTLRLAKYKFDVQDIDPDMPRYMAVSPSQLRALLADTTITSADYNTVRALVDGKLNSFMGFNFIMTNRLDLETDATVKFSVTTGEFDASGTAGTTGRRCLAWIPDGVIVSTGIDMKSRVGERADKSYSTQVYGAMSIGATRLEDVKTLYINCAE